MLIYIIRLLNWSTVEVRVLYELYEYYVESYIFFQNYFSISTVRAIFFNIISNINKSMED